MTGRLLEQKQSILEKKIMETARRLGLSNDSVEPILDGVCDCARYMDTSPRIMWVLKEPYDEMENGMPCGGGWSIVRDCFRKDDAWSAPSWQPIIYAMYGYRHHLLWDDMDWIRDNRDMAKALQEIAYINVSKMPGGTVSNDGFIAECYRKWKSVLFEQISTYDPEVIVFAATFKHFREDMKGDLAKLSDMVIDGSRAGEAYRWKGRLLLSVMHPNNKSIKREQYVDSIIQTLRACVGNGRLG